jgi:hypothetical protein
MPGWTIATLKEHFERLREDDQRAVQAALASAEKAVSAALVSAEKAITKQEAADTKRADASNEIRGAMLDQQRQFPSKVEVDSRFTDVERRMIALEKKADMDAGKSAGNTQSSDAFYKLLAGGSALTAIGFGLYALLK